MSANRVQRENSRSGTPGWEIPADAGTVITGGVREPALSAVIDRAVREISAKAGCWLSRGVR
jgi:hypothetical protein